MNTTATVTTYDRTASENRKLVIAHHKSVNGSMKALTGNTWPLKSMLFANGSLWNKELKVVEVPAHVYEMCQAAVDGYAATHVKVKSDKPKADKPAPVKATVATPVNKPTPVAAIKGTATQATLCRRLANLGEISDTLVTDLLQAGLVESAANVVKALAIFNQEHANLLK